MWWAARCDRCLIRKPCATTTMVRYLASGWSVDGRIPAGPSVCPRPMFLRAITHLGGRVFLRPFLPEVAAGWPSRLRLPPPPPLSTGDFWPARYSFITFWCYCSRCLYFSPGRLSNPHRTPLISKYYLRGWFMAVAVTSVSMRNFCVRPNRRKVNQIKNISTKKFPQYFTTNKSHNIHEKKQIKS